VAEGGGRQGSDRIREVRDDMRTGLVCISLIPAFARPYGPSGERTVESVRVTSPPTYRCAHRPLPPTCSKRGDEGFGLIRCRSLPIGICTQPSQPDPAHPTSSTSLSLFSVTPFSPEAAREQRTPRAKPTMTDIISIINTLRWSTSSHALSPYVQKLSRMRETLYGRLFAIIVIYFDTTNQFHNSLVHFET